MVVSLVNDAEGMTGEEAGRLFERFYMGMGPGIREFGTGAYDRQMFGGEDGGTIRAEADEGSLQSY